MNQFFDRLFESQRLSTSYAFVALAQQWVKGKLLFLTLVISLFTAMAMQTLGPLPLVVFCIFLWSMLLFYYYPILLLFLWLILLYISLILSDIWFPFGSMFLLPLDPAYFMGTVFLGVHFLVNRNKLFAILKQNIFLSILLLIIIAYIILYTPIYGKSAIGEARKFYFVFFFPILAALSIKTAKDLRLLLMGIIFMAVAILVTSFARLVLGSSLRSLANAPMSLFLLLTFFSILVAHINGWVIIHRALDLTVLLLSLAVVLMTQHRSVFLAGGVGLLLLLMMYRYRQSFLPKIIMGLFVFFTVMQVIMISSPTFENYTLNQLAGIYRPEADATASWRMAGWQQMLGALSWEGLAFGEGLGSYYTWSYAGHVVNRTPHNGYVQFILKFGLLGLGVYILFAVKFFWTALAVNRRLTPGPMKACLEMGILNFGAAQAYMMGYAIELIMLVFFALALGAMDIVQKPRSTLSQI